MNVDWERCWFLLRFLCAEGNPHCLGAPACNKTPANTSLQSLMVTAETSHHSFEAGQYQDSHVTLLERCCLSALRTFALFATIYAAALLFRFKNLGPEQGEFSAQAETLRPRLAIGPLPHAAP